jgi:NAD(P)-dependent dehydrogenase (short-subunit alcohol dehydrogenase family)
LTGIAGRPIGPAAAVTLVWVADPLPEATSFAVANGGVEGFVRAAALSLPRGIRINAVNSGIAADSEAKSRSADLLRSCT